MDLEFAAHGHSQFSTGREHAVLSMQRALAAIDNARACSRCPRPGDQFIAVGTRAGHVPICPTCHADDRERDAYRTDLDRMDRAWHESERQRAHASAPVLRGCAVEWGDVARLEDGSTEAIRRGAFARSLRSRASVVCRIDHDPRLQLGTTADAWSLEVVEGESGLLFRLELENDTAAVRTLRVAARDERIAGVSLGFNNSVGTRAGRHRTVSDADLVEISILIAPKIPAYRKTWAGLEPVDGVLLGRAAHLERQMYRRTLAAA
jgi:HK97 family phage prohead protease